jgi:hypothetical protein
MEEDPSMMRDKINRFALGMAFVFAVLSAVPALAHPGSAIVVDGQGQVWFLDTGDGLWKIDTHGELTRLGGDRFHWMALDQDDRFARAALPRDVKRADEEPSILIASDFPIAMGSDGILYYPSAASSGRLRIMRAMPDKPATPLITLPATTASGQTLQWVNGLTAGADGHVYFTENSSIRRVTMQGQLETVVSDVRVEGCVRIPGNPPSEGPLLRGLCVDAAGVIYVAASGCGSVLKIATDGRVGKLVQLEAPWSPTAVALFGTDVFVLEYLHTETEDRRAWVPRVRKVSADGTSAIIANVER